MATCTRSSSLMLTHSASSVHSQGFTPSICCFNPRPSLEAFSPYPPVLKPGEAIWTDVNLRRKAMPWPCDDAFSARDGEVAENKDEMEEGVDGGGASTMDTVVVPNEKKGKAALPIKKEERRTMKFTEIQGLTEKKRGYDLKTEIYLLKEAANSKFVEIVEAHFQLNINPKYDDQQLRAKVVLRKGT